jgi:hypothetical protein
MKYYFWTGLSTDVKDTTQVGIGALALETDTGDEYQWSGSAWNKAGTAGAAHVRTSSVLGAYDADKATSTTSAREAIPSGAQKLWVCNESVTTLQSVRFVFGDSAIDAVATGGYRVSPGITTAAGDNGPKELEVEVPRDATHWAYIAESGTPTINVVWKF